MLLHYRERLLSIIFLKFSTHEAEYPFANCLAGAILHQTCTQHVTYINKLKLEFQRGVCFH